MDLHDLRKAAAAADDLRRVEAHIEAIADFEVVGVVIANGSGKHNEIELRHDRSGGCGSVTSICWSDDLQADLTAAFKAVFRKKADEARERLVDLGVSVA